jgi:hypothetical protein
MSPPRCTPVACHPRSTTPPPHDVVRRLSPLASRMVYTGRAECPPTHLLLRLVGRSVGRAGGASGQQGTNSSTGGVMPSPASRRSRRGSVGACPALPCAVPRCPVCVPSPAGGSMSPSAYRHTGATPCAPFTRSRTSVANQLIHHTRCHHCLLSHVSCVRVRVRVVCVCVCVCSPQPGKSRGGYDE